MVADLVGLGVQEVRDPQGVRFRAVQDVQWGVDGAAGGVVGAQEGEHAGNGRAIVGCGGRDMTRASRA